jgi:hypothetical protein
MNKKLLLLAGMIMMLALAALPAQAEINAPKNDPDLSKRLTALLAGSFLTLECPVPAMQPLAPNLTRDWRPSEEELIKQFFGSRDYVTKTKDITSPLWGKGKRYWVAVMQKSDVFAGTNSTEGGGKQGTKETESVLMSLDIYQHGFVYVNNAPHPPAIKVEKVEKAGQPLQFNRKRAFTDADGQKLAEQLVAQYVAPLKVPKGFQSNVQTTVQDYGQQLYQYRVRSEYVTSYKVYGSGDDQSRKVLGSQPVSVPVYDAYVNLLMDGDKNLAGMEYFWDGGMQVSGEAQESIYLGTALTNAREYLFDYFKSEPPLISISNVTFGYVQEAKGSGKLVPAWLFDAWYMRGLSSMDNYQTVPEFYGHNSVKIPLTFGVNAMTGKTFIL